MSHKKKSIANQRYRKVENENVGIRCDRCSNIQCDQLIRDPIQSDKPRHDGGVKSTSDSGYTCEQRSTNWEVCGGLTFVAWLLVFDDSGNRVGVGLLKRPVVRAFLRGGGIVLDVEEDAVAMGTVGLREFSEGRKL